MTMRLLTRVLLGEEGGTGRMNVLVDSVQLHPGHVISLTGVDGWWEVLETHEVVRAETIKSNRTWQEKLKQ